MNGRGLDYGFSRVLIVVFAFAFACETAGISLWILAPFAEKLAGASGMSALTAHTNGKVGVVPVIFLGTVTALLIARLTILPVGLFLLCAEVFRLTKIYWYLAAGLIFGVIIPFAVFGKFSPLYLGPHVGAYAVCGTLAGFVYWIIAIRLLGRRPDRE